MVSLRRDVRTLLERRNCRDSEPRVQERLVVDDGDGQGLQQSNGDLLWVDGESGRRDDGAR